MSFFFSLQAALIDREALARKVDNLVSSIKEWEDQYDKLQSDFNEQAEQHAKQLCQSMERGQRLTEVEKQVEELQQRIVSLSDKYGKALAEKSVLEAAEKVGERSPLKNLIVCVSS